MMTAADALHSISICRTGRSKRNAHARHTQNAHDSHLGPPLHSQRAHQKNRQDAHCEIAEGRKGTVHIGHGDDDLDIHTPPLDTRVKCRPRPEILERLALQQHDEHEDDAGHHRQGHD